MATTAAEVLANVQALGYGTDTEAQQLKMLNQVQRRVLNVRRWTFLLEPITKTATIGTSGVVFDTTYQRIDAVRIKDSGSQITPIDLPTLRQWQLEDTTTRRPEFWAHFGSEILLYPTPDQAYPILIDAVKNPPAITTGASVVAVPDSHVDILAYGVIMQLTFRERDWDGHNFSRQMYAELFSEMIAQYGMKQRQQSDRVINSGQWTHFDVDCQWPG